MLTILSLIPSYLIFFALLFVILPTIVAIFLRYSLYQHLLRLSKRLKRLLRGDRTGEQPPIVQQLEQRLQDTQGNLEQINTPAIIEAIYSQEKFPFLSLSLRCEQIDYFNRILPNLLLSFGLLGTFLGITINLAGLSQTISQVEIADIQSLVEQLNQPLQGMGIAFVTSLVAVACSSLLIVINFFWNTTLVKSALINNIEDYLDNIYLPQLPIQSPMEKAVERLVGEFGGFLTQFGETVEQAVVHSIGEPVQQIVKENRKTSELAGQVYSGMLDSSSTIAQGATSFRQAASTIDQSNFAEKLANATADLAIAQGEFAQSSKVLNRSTQSLDQTLETLKKSVQQMVEITTEITTINQQYAQTFASAQKRMATEEADLKQIKSQITDLVDSLKKV